MEFQYAPGATPLDPDEAAGLVPVHITTQVDLNAWEQANIVLGDRWAARQKKRDLLDEGFVRDLHRHIVLIHAFSNGNGRHSRLMADLLIMRLGQPRLTWGGASATLTTIGAIRNRYLVSLREADQGQIHGLNEFARS